VCAAKREAHKKKGRQGRQWIGVISFDREGGGVASDVPCRKELSQKNWRRRFHDQAEGERLQGNERMISSYARLWTRMGGGKGKVKQDKKKEVFRVKKKGGLLFEGNRQNPKGHAG